MEVLDLPDPRPLIADEVLVEVVAAGVGNWDDIVRTGGWDVGIGPPVALGVEAAGRIVAVGDEVTGVAVGDEVMTHPLPLRGQGAWAELLIAPAALVARRPPNVSWEVAGAFPVPALTADQVLECVSEHVPEGGTLLVHGAGGVTGTLLVELAALRGLRVLATAGPSGRERVLAAGAQEVLDYHDASWLQEVRRLAGGGVAAAANAVRGGAAQAVDAVADGGCLVTITSGLPARERDITMVDLYVHPDGDRLAALAALLGEGRLTMSVGASYPLEEAGAGLARAVSGARGGAGVVLP
ncbi:NADP-dependent oxidoreductase [Nonomuraea maritima]|uniref:NADP-dependent oxidoreductase n=1 Tax=Nonomuraea maritima TaxID=683260 RepID=UPI0037216573